MRKLVSFLHISLDGFVAGPNGEMDWVYVGEDLFDYAGERTDQSDTALYGRVTYELMESYWPTAANKPDATRHDIQHSKWYNSVKKVLVSRTMKNTSSKSTRIIRENLPAEIEKLKAEPGKEIVIFGSPAVTNLLSEAGLIDEYWLFVNPILLGNGIPLYRSTNNNVKLKLLFSKAFDSGVVCLHYEAR